MMIHPHSTSEVTDSNPSNKRGDERRKQRRNWLRFYELASAPAVFVVVVAGLLLEPMPAAHEPVPPPPSHERSPSTDRDASAQEEFLCALFDGSSRVGA
ncbi:MAG TPA: hypothetical protein VGL81_37305 [Polyangiaceae bacterium]|jgi:hypothetical protein